MQTIHAIQTLRTVCGFLDMGDGCCLIFNKNQLMFIVRKSITAQIKKKIILFFSLQVKTDLSETPLCAITATVPFDTKTVRRYRSRKLRTGLFRRYEENAWLVAFDMMAKTWNFVTKKIADGVNKFLSLFCLF